MTVEYIFSYGTLQNSSVQTEVFNKAKIGEKDFLSGYIIENINIENSHYPNIKFTNSKKNVIEGSLYELTKEELVKADFYETNSYKRIKVTLISGKVCWVYIANH